MKFVVAAVLLFIAAVGASPLIESEDDVEQLEGYVEDETEIGDPSPSDNTDELADLFDSTTYNAELNDEEHSEDPHGYGSGVNPITIPTRIPPRRCQLCCGRHWWRLRRRCPKVIRCKCGCGYRCRKRKGRKRNDQQNAADIKDQSADLSQV